MFRWLREKRGDEIGELGKILIAGVVLVVLIVGVILLFKIKGGSLLDSIKGLLRFGR